jgi:hypothetical protein
MVPGRLACSNVGAAATPASRCRVREGRKATRPVPIPPVLVRLVREHIRSSAPPKTAGCSVRPRGAACCPRSTGSFGKRLDSRC